MKTQSTQNDTQSYQLILLLYFNLSGVNRNISSSGTVILIKQVGFASIKYRIFHCFTVE